MTKTSYIIIGIAIIAGIGLLYSYYSIVSMGVKIAPDEIAIPPDVADEPSEPQLPNPASAYCVNDMKGELKMFETSEGQVGLCHLPDGRWCEEWKLYWTNICVLPEGVSGIEQYGKG